MFKIIETKIEKNGIPIHICETENQSGREYFANGKRYWIAYRDGSPRRSINVSDSLKYIRKKFAEIKSA